MTVGDLLNSRQFHNVFERNVCSSDSELKPIKRKSVWGGPNKWRSSHV